MIPSSLGELLIRQVDRQAGRRTDRLLYPSSAIVLSSWWAFIQDILIMFLFFFLPEPAFLIPF